MNLDFYMTNGGFRSKLPYGELNISGDDEFGYRPWQLMVTSIAVCSGGVLRKILEKKRLDVQDIQIKADVTRNESEADRIEKIHLKFIIKGRDLVEDAVQRSMEVAKKNCSMVQSVKESIQITETFEIIDLSY